MRGRLLNPVLLTLLAALPVVAPAATAAQATAPRRSEAVMPDGTRLRLEIVSTEAERQRGLMHRPSLSGSAGMLFVFERLDVHAFWMKNTLIALDILWLDAEGRVVWIAERLPPCKADPCPIYEPGAASVMALEVNAGFVATHGIVRGQRIALSGVPAMR